MQFSRIHLGCHGIPERCFKIKGKHMQFCARCVGASIGHIAVALNFFIASMLPALYAIPGIAIMLLDWTLQNKARLYHSNFSRLFTGIIGGYSVGLLIWCAVKVIVQYSK